MPWAHVIVACLVLVIVGAAVCDVRTRRVPNWVTVPAAAAGLLLGLGRGGAAGLLASAAGVAIAVGAGALLCTTARLGSGDVKLLAAIGALMGPAFLLRTFLFGALVGGVLAVGWLVKQRLSPAQVGYVLLAQRAGLADEVIATMRPAGGIPYAVAIAAGAVMALAL